MYRLCQRFILWMKYNFFVKLLKEGKKEKICNAKISKGRTTFMHLLGLLLYLFMYACAFVIIMFIVVLVFAILKVFPEQNNQFVTIAISLIGLAGVIYTEEKKKRAYKREKNDESVELIVQYLIEIKRGNYDTKIYKQDLSKIFLNAPNTLLIILRDIQLNVNKMNKENSENIKEILNKEISFLILYIREYYNSQESNLIFVKENENMISDLIENSSEMKDK